MNPRRKLMSAERERKARIRRIRRECTEVRRLGRGQYVVRLKIAHQSFDLGLGTGPTNMRRARWYTTQLAIALNRLKFGD